MSNWRLQNDYGCRTICRNGLPGDSHHHHSWDLRDRVYVHDHNYAVSRIHDHGLFGPAHFEERIDGNDDD